MKPIFLLVSANDPDAPLSQLADEVKRIVDIVQDVPNWEVQTIYNATLKDIVSAFTQYGNRIAVLHYAGHSNSTQLATAEGGTEAQPLAGILGMLSDLRLVFLNGCANKAQVNFFHEAQVGAVIGTARPVNDLIATSLAVRFYQVWARGNDLQTAFRVAIEEQTALQALQRDDKGTGYRFLGAITADTVAADLPWDLYLHPQLGQNVGIWTLTQRIIEDQTSATQGDIPINQQWVVPLFMRVLELYDHYVTLNLAHLPDNPHLIIPEELPAAGSQDELDLYNNIKAYLLKYLPLPLALELSNLFTVDLSRKDAARFQQLLLVYQRTVKLSAFIMLAQWAHLQSKLAITPPDNVLPLGRQFIAQSRDNYKTFDYAALEQAIADSLRPYADRVWLPESLQTSSEYAAALAEMERYRLDWIRGLLMGADFKKLCDQAEADLAHILLGKAYLMFYPLQSVKDIRVEKPYRQAVPVFSHRIIALSGEKMQITGKIPYINDDDYTDTYSIILMRHLDPDGYLNLAPWVVDGNAYDDESALCKLMFWAHTTDAEAYFYEPIHEGKREDVLNKDRHALVSLEPAKKSTSAAAGSGGLLGALRKIKQEESQNDNTDSRLYTEVKRLVELWREDWKM